MGQEPTNSVIANLDVTPGKPKTEGDWLDLEFAARALFKPRLPIDEDKLFAGRIPQARALLDVIYESGAHAILYGERGVGKTSLANIIKDRIIARASTMTEILRVSCNPSDTFATIWSHVFYDYQWGDHNVADRIKTEPTPFTIYKIAETLGATRKFYVVVLDEFDRIRDAETKTLLADTIKYFSDNPVRFTMVVVGVGQSIDELFGSHPSIQRCCVQIRMPRMKPAELSQIVTERVPKLGMTISPEIVQTMVSLSHGLPGYMHLLGQLSAVVAIESRTLDITKGCLDTAVSRALEASDESVRHDYYQSVQSTKPDNRYREVLLACARAKKNELGQFSAADVCEPYSDIMGKSMKIPHFARHLNAFCDPDRGPALIKSGRQKGYLYRFANPLLEPLAVMIGAPTTEK